MFKIRHGTEAFATLDGIDDLKPLDQALRHLSQRVYFPAFGRDGRADLYPLHAICALRVIHSASAFGLDRATVDQLARWLLMEPTGVARRVNIDGGQRAMSPAEEAVERVKEGQVFDLIMSFRRGGSMLIFADWPDDEAAAKTTADGVFESVGLPEVQAVERARLSLPASALIKELLPLLGETTH